MAEALACLGVESELPHVKSIDDSLDMCIDAIEKLASKLGVKIEKDLDMNQIKFTFKKKLMWPWREKEVGKILQVIEKHKSTFILAVAGDTLGVSLAIQDDVDHIKNDVGNIKDDVVIVKNDVMNIKCNVAAIIDPKIQILGWLKSNIHSLIMSRLVINTNRPLGIGLFNPIHFSSGQRTPGCLYG